MARGSAGNVDESPDQTVQQEEKATASQWLFRITSYGQSLASLKMPFARMALEGLAPAWAEPHEFLLSMTGTKSHGSLS